MTAPTLPPLDEFTFEGYRNADGSVGSAAGGDAMAAALAEVLAREAEGGAARRPARGARVGGRGRWGGAAPRGGGRVRAARRAGSIINRAALDIDLLKVNTKNPNDFVAPTGSRLPARAPALLIPCVDLSTKR